MESQDELDTVDELAKYLKVPAQTIYRWRHAGSGPPAIRVGKYLRFKRSDVNEWLESQADKPRPAA